MARNPYPLYAEMRVTGDLVPLGPGLWATARWSICDALLRDRRLDRQFLAVIERRYGLERAAAPVFQTFARMLLIMTPPQAKIPIAALQLNRTDSSRYSG